MINKLFILFLFILKPVSAQASEDYMFLLPLLIFIVLVSVLIPLIFRLKLFNKNKLWVLVAIIIGGIAITTYPFEEGFMEAVYPFGVALITIVAVIFFITGFKMVKNR
tara:strand:+ start:292 stop:615 length:324 start_codon:yes stop_codon:yes gene_type:complete